ncbi:CPBP family intramembrane glutamic endopeptidase [Clavibacter sepedonicus]|uniref:Integral membrane protein n=1 Tax=Clavibacter sepedonicus TaxID=31964 RepID=B0RHM0_CLASE|nr:MULTISPECIES: CPBP family intramembrane glutamic endopeptidase [Clavibacter]MBD5380512.1 CPBP family intramembrane metalloprotease [Clavibacter sp.]OQJ48154.1 CAAX protease family protein [Clavibacter sepedonicus]OQJ54600.1 CAAX protease family protein [Clavibacter sepedonicus]UUK66175.1 CPBP family intramembrane metalloprotease [Clavibacter sepedonicus]CAQ02581.1 putative integral membrane protein [Clavibacter sepedonicus]
MTAAAPHPAPASSARADGIPDPRLDAQTRDPRSWLPAVAAALLGWAALGIALGLAIGIAEAVTRATGADEIVEMALQAVLMSALAVSAVVLLRRRLDRRSLASLGLSRRIGRPLALGVGVGALTGAVVWVPAGLLGWIRVDDLDLVAFAGFLLLNGIVLAFYEAIPEELAFRGYMWTNLRDGLGLVAATILTTALFPLLSVVIAPVRWIVDVLTGADPDPLSVTPGSGQDPIVFVVQLVLFGLALIAARRIPVEGAVLVAVAFHWTQLTVTRAVLGGMSWTPSFGDVVFVEPDAIVLVLVHIVLGGAVFVAVRKAWEWRTPELRVPRGARVQETDLR